MGSNRFCEVEADLSIFFLFRFCFANTGTMRCKHQYYHKKDLRRKRVILPGLLNCIYHTFLDKNNFYQHNYTVVSIGMTKGIPTNERKFVLDVERKFPSGSKPRSVKNCGTRSKKKINFSATASTLARRTCTRARKPRARTSSTSSPLASCARRDADALASWCRTNPVSAPKNRGAPGVWMTVHTCARACGFRGRSTPESSFNLPRHGVTQARLSFSSSVSQCFEPRLPVTCTSVCDRTNDF